MINRFSSIAKKTTKKANKKDYKAVSLVTLLAFRNKFIRLLEEKQVLKADKTLAIALFPHEIFKYSSKEVGSESFMCYCRWAQTVAPGSSIVRLKDAGVVTLNEYSQDQHLSRTGSFTTEIVEAMAEPIDFMNSLNEKTQRFELVDFFTGKRLDGRNVNKSKYRDQNGNSYPPTVIDRIKAMDEVWAKWPINNAFALMQHRYAEAKKGTNDYSRLLQAQGSLHSILGCKGYWEMGYWKCAGAYEIQDFSGRLNAIGGGFVSLPRDFQAVLLKGTDYHNYDLVKAHNVFALSDAKRLGISVPNLNKYVSDFNSRVELSCKAGLKESDLKVLVLALTYGGNLPTPDKAKAVLNSKLPLNKMDTALAIAVKEANNKENTKSRKTGLTSNMKVCTMEGGGRALGLVNSGRKIRVKETRRREGERTQGGREDNPGGGWIGKVGERGAGYIVYKYTPTNNLVSLAAKRVQATKTITFHYPKNASESLSKYDKIYAKMYPVLKPFYDEFAQLYTALVEEEIAEELAFRVANPRAVEMHGFIKNAAGVKLKILDDKMKPLPFSELKKSIPAHRYQGKESYLMGAVTLAIKKAGIDVVASCHDGVVTNKPIPQSLLDDIQTRIDLPKHELVLKPLELPEDYQAALEAQAPSSSGNAIITEAEFLENQAFGEECARAIAEYLRTEHEYLPLDPDYDGEYFSQPRIKKPVIEDMWSYDAIFGNTEN